MSETDPTKQLELVMRNTAEVVTEDEIKDQVMSPGTRRAYVGYEPSGDLHLGHLVTINKLVDLQKAGYEVVILLADIHAWLNKKRETLAEIHDIAESMRELFLASGLKPNKTEFVYGSDFQQDDDYVMDVWKLMTEVSINKSEKAVSQGIASSDSGLRLSHATYPIMQALDIPYLDIDLAVGGMAQRRVHMLGRDHLPDIGYEAPTCLHTPLLMGLDGEPMSSSEGNLIALNDDTETIEDKIAGAYCPAGELEGNPVVDIFQYHLFPRFEQVTISRADEYGGDVTYLSFDEFASDFADGSLHPKPTKQTAAEYLDRLLTDTRRVDTTA